MTGMQQREAAKHFAEFWRGKGYEKGESQKFRLSLPGKVYGVAHPAEYISFEDQVHLDHTGFIDGYIRDTRVLIEQKGLGKDFGNANGRRLWGFTGIRLLVDPAKLTTSGVYRVFPEDNPFEMQEAPHSNMHDGIHSTKRSLEEQLRINT